MNSTTDGHDKTRTEDDTMNSKDLTIGVLSTTAVILLVGLILINSRPAAVYASGMGDRGGDYVMLSGALWEQEELLYVINAELNRMIAYRYDVTAGQIVASGGQELSNFLEAKPPARKKSKGRRRRRHP